MATPEIKAEDILLGPKETVRDNAQLYVTDEVAKGMTIAPKLGFSDTESKWVSWFTREKTAKEQFDENLIMKPMPSENAELLEVSGMELTPNNERVITWGYQYSVDLNDLNDSPESYLMDIQDLCWGITEAIETNVAAVLISAAPNCTFSPLNGDWATSTTIAKDLRGYRSEYAARDIKGMLRETFLNRTQFDQLGNWIIDTEGIAALKETDETITYGGLNNNYAAFGIADGAILGFDSMLPPGLVKYRKMVGGYKPITSKEGTEQYLPVINMKVEDTEVRRMEPVRTFKFAASWRTAITRPAGIIYDTGI
jgi:hypothetical protein